MSSASRMLPASCWAPMVPTCLRSRRNRAAASAEHAISCSAVVVTGPVVGRGGWGKASLAFCRRRSILSTMLSEVPGRRGGPEAGGGSRRVSAVGSGSGVSTLGNVKVGVRLVKGPAGGRRLGVPSCTVALGSGENAGDGYCTTASRDR